MAAVRVELQGLAEKEEKGMQRQTTRARIAMFLIMFTTPLGSPLYFLGTLFYQLCLVSGKLTIKACVVTYIALVFFAVAWIPWVNFALYLKTRHDTTGDTETAVNGIAPIVGLYIFCAWGFVVAFRHFSIADSYEHEYDRASIRHLKGVALDPPVVVDGETRDSREILTNAFTLYRYLKGDSPPYQTFVTFDCNSTHDLCFRTHVVISFTILLSIYLSVSFNRPHFASKRGQYDFTSSHWFSLPLGCGCF